MSKIDGVIVYSVRFNVHIHSVELVLAFEYCSIGFLAYICGDVNGHVLLIPVQPYLISYCQDL